MTESPPSSPAKGGGGGWRVPDAENKVPQLRASGRASSYRSRWTPLSKKVRLSEVLSKLFVCLWVISFLTGRYARAGGCRPGAFPGFLCRCGTPQPPCPRPWRELGCNIHWIRSPSEFGTSKGGYREGDWVLFLQVFFYQWLYYGLVMMGFQTRLVRAGVGFCRQVTRQVRPLLPPYLG